MSSSIKWIVAGLALAAGACGGNGSVTGPASVPTGASIQGTVQSGASASANGAVRAQSLAASMRVSVVGTAVSTVTDDQGRFRLDGISGSSAGLRFEAPGIDARGDVSGLVAGQVLTVQVQISGSQAVISTGRSDDPGPSPTPSPSATPRPSPEPSPEPEGEREFRGAIDNLNAPDLMVSGQRVHTDGNTRFRRSGQAISFGDLRVGQQVEIQGVAQTDGSVLATKVTVEDDGPGDDNGNDGGEVTLRGSVDSVTPPSLHVSGRLVMTDGNTRITRKGDRIDLSAIHAGDQVEVEGASRSDGSVLARKISLED